MRRLIFLGGIPASGKSTIGQTLEKKGWVAHVIAGTLLRDNETTRAHYQHPVVANTADVVAKQSLIVQNFKRIVEGISHDDVLLDGHFVVPTGSDFYRIPLRVFETLNIEQFAMIHCDPSTVFERLQTRGQREWWNASVDQLIVYQDEELSHAQDIASMTARPLLVIEERADPIAAMRSLICPL